MKRFILFGITCLMFGAYSSASVAETRWDMPAPGGENRIQTRLLEDFVKDASNRSSSALQITLHPDESLIRQNDTLDALKSNIVSIAAINADTVLRAYLDIDPSILALTTNSYDKARALYAALRPALSQALARDNLVVLTPVPHMGVGIFSTRQLNSIHELRKQSFTSSETGLSYFTEQMGSTLAAKTPDDIPAGKFNFIFGDALSGKPYELPGKGIGYFYDIKLLVPFDLVVARKDAFDGMPEEERRALIDAAAAFESQSWDVVKNEEVAAMGLLKQNGVKIISSSSGVGQDFKMLSAAVAAEYQSLWKEKGFNWPE